MTSVSSPTVRIGCHGCMECPGFRVRMRDLHAPTPHFFQPLRPLIGFPNAGEIQPAQLMVLLGSLASCILSSFHQCQFISLLPSIDLPNTTAIPTAHCIKLTPPQVIIHSSGNLPLNAPSLTARALQIHPTDELTSSLPPSTCSLHELPAIPDAQFNPRASNFLDIPASCAPKCFLATSTILETHQPSS